MVRKILVLFSALALSACLATGTDYRAAVGSMPKLNETMTRITLIRDVRVRVAALNAEVSVNGLKERTLGNGSFAYIDTYPGQVALRVDNWSTAGSYSISPRLKPNRVYYFRISPSGDSPFGDLSIQKAPDKKVQGPFTIRPISGKTAREILPKLVLAK